MSSHDAPTCSSRDRLKNVGARIVLAIAAIATIATSLVRDIIVSHLDVAVPNVVHVRVRFSEAAVREADILHIDFTRTAGIRDVTVISDDPRQPPVEVDVRVGALELCGDVGPCELGFSLDPGDGPSDAVVEVAATAERQGSSFSSDASVEVLLE